MESEGTKMANQWLLEGFARGGFTEEVIVTLLSEVNALMGQVAELKGE
jgi:hypothetical protein